MKNILFLLLVALFLFSCAAETTEESSSEKETITPETATATETAVEDAPAEVPFDYCKCIEEANKKADEVINGTLSREAFLDFTEVECAPFSEMTVEEMKIEMDKCSDLVQEYQEKIMTNDVFFGE